MKSATTPQQARHLLQSRGVVRFVSVWLVSFVFVLGVIFGQATQAGSAQVHHPDTVIETALDTGQETAPACHPGLACTVFVLPDGPVTARTLSIVKTLRPVLTQAQRRFGGPSVTLPPPRTLI